MSLAGYTGNILELKPDSTFTNRSYSDVVGFFNPRTNKGKWQSTSDSTIRLKYGCSKLDLVYRHFNNLTFLVPENKLEIFEKAFTKNKENIQEVCEASFDDQHYLIYSKLADFSKICFISLNEKPKTYVTRESLRLGIQNIPGGPDVYANSFIRIDFSSVQDLTKQLIYIDSTKYDVLIIKSRQVDSIMPVITRFRNTQVVQIFTEEDISIDSNWVLMQNLLSIDIFCNSVSEIDSRIFSLSELEYFGVTAETKYCPWKLKRQYKRGFKNHSLKYGGKYLYLDYNRFSLRKGFPQNMD